MVTSESISEDKVSKSQILFQCSKEFKDFVDTYAQTHRMSTSALAKRALAQMVGYANIDAELKRAPRTPKYGTPEEQEREELRRRSLRAWAQKAISKYLKAGKIEFASAVAMSLEDKDYDSLDMLRESENESAE